VTESVSGTGIAAPQHRVNLNWAPSTSSGVAGYYVYRGPQQGGPYNPINSALDPNTTYTDNSVQAGQTYYYVVTAINSAGLQSGYSNQVQAVIPYP
jgi:fibronectin type 3 domain-containing protein